MAHEIGSITMCTKSLMKPLKQKKEPAFSREFEQRLDNQEK